MKPFCLLSTILLIFTHHLQAQEYTVNGSATKDNCHCYTLTPDLNTQSGSVWNNIKIDLTKSFDFTFDINLGCDDNGADGIVFVLQPISTSVGTSGGGLGFEGVKPSVGVTIDTWQNIEPNSNDPAYDHIAIQLNGNINHLDPASNIAGPVTALAGSDNIEDCKRHVLRIIWDASAKHLSALVDGSPRVDAFKDLVADVFGGNPFVFWGFTGSTGGARNLQQVCTALTPSFKSLANQKRCINEPVTFYDSTISFAPVLKKYWDFGDGTAIDSVNQNPVHTYAAAGDFVVKQKVIGADGCVEINTQTVKIGSIPVADFNSAGACVNSSLQLTDLSNTAVGTINEWQWILANGDTATTANPAAIYSTSGIRQVKLTVKSLEGCVSSATTKDVTVFPLPNTDFNVSGTFCKKADLLFTNASGVSSGSIVSLMYNFGNGQQSQQANATMHFDTSKNYNVVLTAVSDKGCSRAKLKSVFILPSPKAAFGYTISCQPETVHFLDSSTGQAGLAITKWNWQLGDGSTSAVQNPSKVYNQSGNVIVKLAVSSSFGCVSDTLIKTIFVPSIPVADFSQSNPLCDGQTVVFSDSSFNNNGAIKSWQWLVNDQVVSDAQSPSLQFSTGSQLVNLLVKNEAGCSGDTASKLLQVAPQPHVAVSFSDGCKNDIINYSAASINGESIANWQWTFGDGGSSAAKDTSHTFKEAGVFNVKLVAVAVTGCTAEKDSSIQIFGTNAFAGNDTVVATHQPVQLQATGGSSYKWSPALYLNTDTAANPIATLSASQRYTVTVTSPVGCPSVASVFIKVYDGPEIYVPRAFTPNGDRLNDVLKALPVGMRTFTNFTIYNRLGEIVFSTGNAAIGWDGIYKGKLQAGAYVWIASGVNYKGTAVMRKGTVLLIK